MKFNNSSVADANLDEAVAHGMKNGYMKEYLQKKYSPSNPTNQQATTDYQEATPEPAFNREKFYDEWKSGKKPLVDAIMSNYTKPVPTLSPEQQQKAKFGSAITDTLSSLGEMFAHGQGARIRNREGATNMQTTNAKIQALQDKDNEEMQRFNGIKTSAELQDFNQQMQQESAARGERRQYLLFNAQQRAAKAKLASDAEKTRQAAELKAAELKEKTRQFNAGHSVDLYNANTSRMGKEEDIKSKGFNVGKAFVKPQDVNQIASEIIKNEKPTVIVMQKDARGNLSPVKVPIDVNSTAETKKALIAKYPQYAENHYGYSVSTPAKPAVNWEKPIQQPANGLLSTQPKVKSIYD